MSEAEGDAPEQCADVCTRERIREICATLDAITDELIALRALGLLPEDVSPSVPALAALALRQRTIDRDRLAKRRMAQLNKAERTERLRMAREYVARKPDASTSQIARAIAAKQNAEPGSVERFLRRNPSWREKKSGQA